MLAQGKKKPGAKPGEVQQGGEEDAHQSIIAFTDEIGVNF